MCICPFSVCRNDEACMHVMMTNIVVSHRSTKKQQLMQKTRMHTSQGGRVDGLALSFLAEGKPATHGHANPKKMSHADEKLCTW